MADKNTYFVNLEEKELVSTLINKADDFYLTLQASGLMDKYMRSYAFYHSANFSSIGGGHQISFGGTEGELSQIVVNHYRNIAEHQLNAITQNRPALEAKAMNSDMKSQAQAYLATGLLDYYMREKHFEEHLKDCCQYAIVYGLGAIKLSWNPLAGKMINRSEYEENIRRTKQKFSTVSIDDVVPIYEGDIEANVISVFDIIYDITNQKEEHDWIMVRTQKNRYDLIAKYPEFENEIMDIESFPMSLVSMSSLNRESDQIYVYEFYQRRSEAVPNGKYVMFVSDKAVFYSGELPYREIPIFMMSPNRILGTRIGYTSMFDVLPIQESLDNLYSTVLTNQIAYGNGIILNPQGSNINVSQLSESMSVIDYNPAAGKIEMLELLKTPREIFDSIGMFIKEAETMSGISSVMRGSPEKNLRSGVSMAMIQTNSIQYLSGLQSTYIRTMERMALGMIQILQDYADSPRIATIVGETGKSYMREFKSEDIRDINRIMIDVANPLTKTIAGKAEMANQLLQYQLLEDPSDYISIMETGQLRSATEDTMKESLLIRQENEAMMNGTEVVAMIHDNHQKHINNHKMVLADPMVRMDMMLVQAVTQHINEHMSLWENSSPQMLFATGQQPLPTMPPMPMAPGAQNVSSPQQNPEGNPSETMMSNDALPPSQQIPNNVPDINMPAGFENAPMTPADNIGSIA